VEGDQVGNLAMIFDDEDAALHPGISMILRG
jgi:hypothetical protein